MKNLIFGNGGKRQGRFFFAFLFTVITLIFVLSQFDLNFLQSRKTILLTCMTGLGIFILNWFIYKFIIEAISQQSKHDRLFWIVASLITGVVISTFLPQPIKTLTLFPHDIIIESRSAISEKCQPLVLTGFRAGSDFVSYGAFSNIGWIRDDNRMFANELENRLEWHGFSRSALISLSGFENGCQARITVDGKATEYSTISNPPAEVLIHLVFSQPGWVSALTQIAIWLFSSLIFLFLICVYYRIFAWVGLEKTKWANQNLEKADTRLIILLAVISLAGYLYFTQPFHLLFEGDSGSYISAGHSLASGNGYIADNGDDFDWWPPLYPFLIAGGYAQHLVDVDTYLRGLHSLLFLLTGMGTFWLFRLTFPNANRWLHFTFSVVVIFSKPVLGCFEFILSEAVFLPAMICSFVFLSCFCKSRSFRSLLACTLCISASALSRYIGIIGLLTGVYLIMLLHETRIIKLVIFAAVFGLFSAFPEILWLIRNYFVTGNLTGLRTPSEVSIWTILEQTTQTLAGWFAPQNQFLTVVVVALGFMLPVLFIITRKLFTAKKTSLSNEDRIILSLVFYSTVYCGFFWYSLTRVANSTVSDRFFVPIMVPLIILIFYSINVLISSAQKPENILKATLTGLLLISMVIPEINHLHSLDASSYDSYQTLSTKKIRDDRLIGFLRQNPLDSDNTIVTNCPDCLNYSLHILNPLYINDETYSIPFLKNASSPFYLVMFSNADIPFGTSALDWGFNTDQSHIESTLERVSGRNFSCKYFENNQDGILVRVVPQ